MRTILLIEDDAENRRLTRSLLDGRDWNVLEAEDGQAGIELALKHRPEVILCDLLMPKSNGFQVCRAIRQQLQPTKIIVISGRDYGADRASAIEAGRMNICSNRSPGHLCKARLNAFCPDRQTIAARKRSREFLLLSTRIEILGSARLHSRARTVNSRLWRKHQLC